MPSSRRSTTAFQSEEVAVADAFVVRALARRRVGGVASVDVGQFSDPTVEERAAFALLGRSSAGPPGVVVGNELVAALVPALSQRRGMKPRIGDRQPARQLPTQIGRDRLGRFAIRQPFERLQHQHRRNHISRLRWAAATRREQIRERVIGEQASAVLGEERVHRIVGHEVRHHRCGVQQLDVRIRASLHPPVSSTPPKIASLAPTIVQQSPAEPTAGSGRYFKSRYSSRAAWGPPLESWAGTSTS